jgi:F-type H+-transporting ATPase subunit epsilon
MATLQVEIVTPEKAVFSGQVGEVVLPSWEGELGVLPEHDALLSLLRCGVTEVRMAEGVKRWVVGRGFADIGGDHVTILTDRATAVEDLDKDEARKTLAEVLAEVESGKLTTEGLKQAQARAEWAQAILDA